MIGDLKPYPTYRDSGVAWLRTVPEHWDVRRLCNICEIRISNVDKHTKNDELPVRLCNYSEVYKNDYIRSRMSFMKATAAKNQIEKFQLQPSDVLITKDSETWHDIGVPAFVEDSEEEIVSGYHLALLRPLSEVVYGRYLFRALQTPDISNRLSIAANGVTRYGLSRNAIKSLCLPVPPLREQITITSFLGKIDHYIGRLINSKQEIVTLLDKHKQTVIHHVVRCGINPNVCLKQSNIEWLGEVPEHWNIAALRHRYQQSLGKMLDSSRITGKHLVPYLRNVDIQWNMINIANLPLMDIRPSEIDRYTVRAGDLLVCEGGETGRCAIWDGSVEVCGYQKALHRLRPISSDKDSVRFLYYAFRVATNRGAFKDGQESTIAHLTGEKLRSHRFAFPPLEEQLKIVNVLDIQIEKINKLISIERRLIDLVGEYRTRLISDVVTGKLDVREVAAQLPKQLSEFGSVDATHAPPHMPTGIDRDPDGSTEECEP